MWEKNKLFIYLRRSESIFSISELKIKFARLRIPSLLSSFRYVASEKVSLPSPSFQNTQKKILVHIVSDEKFIDYAFQQFESVAQGASKFVIVGKERPLKFIKKATVEFYSTRQVVRLFKSKECVAIIFHSLPQQWWYLLSHIPEEKKVIWIGWGYDYYGACLSSIYPNGFLLEKTKKILAQIHRETRISVPISKSRISGLFEKKGRRLLQKASVFLVPNTNQKRYEDLQHPLARVDIFSPVLDIEYQLIRQCNPWLRAKYIPWNYYAGRQDFISYVRGESLSEPGHDILVGNSASPWNNHLEIFDLLYKHVDLSGRKIFTPLSYGGNERYKQKIIEEGRKTFGEKFHPLTNFISRDEYIKLLHHCGYAFMNHLRQQAVGNVNIMLYKGASVYLNTQNPLYTWLKGKGCNVRSMEEISKYTGSGKYGLKPLRHDQQLLNIEIVKRYQNEDTSRLRTKNLIDVALAPR